MGQVTCMSTMVLNGKVDSFSDKVRMQKVFMVIRRTNFLFELYTMFQIVEKALQHLRSLCLNCNPRQKFSNAPVIFTVSFILPSTLKNIVSVFSQK